MRTWPPDYQAVMAERVYRLDRLQNDPSMFKSANEFYRTHCVEWIEDWCVTVDPRNAGSDTPVRMPFILFDRQRELVDFLLGCLSDQESGLVEKCRTAGATWVCSAVSVWLWRYWPGAAIGWGSRKAELVDRIGVMDSIFEKIRSIIVNLPREMLPVGFKSGDHLSYMRVVNPETGATISGESGDNIGRGGRSLIYFKDESAHYERPEKIEAALSENTRVQIDISSVNGLGNVFHRRRDNGIDWSPGAEFPKGKTRVFVFDWRDHPAMTEEWYAQKRAKAIDDGLLHVFAQEVERNYSAALQGTIIPAEWVESAVDAHVKLGIVPSGARVAALDVSDGGGDTNALATRHSFLLTSLTEWGGVDTGVTTRKAVTACDELGAPSVDLFYDCIGVGAGVKAEANRLLAEKLMPVQIRLYPWNAGAGPEDPDKPVVEGDKQSPLNKDFYGNLKAQGWWALRRRFEKTHRAIHEGIKYPPHELISIPKDLPLRRKLMKELSQPTASKSSAKLKLIVDKAPEGTKSPNLGDAVMMAFHPIKVKRPMHISDGALAQAMNLGMRS